MKRKLLKIILFILIILLVFLIVFKNIYKRKNTENNQPIDKNTQNENYSYVELKDNAKVNFLEENYQLLFSDINIDYHEDKTELSFNITNKSDNDIYMGELYMYGITTTNKFTGHFYLEYNDTIKSNENIQNIKISIPYKIEKLKVLYFEFTDTKNLD